MGCSVVNQGTQSHLHDNFLFSFNFIFTRCLLATEAFLQLTSLACLLADYHGQAQGKVSAFPCTSNSQMLFPNWTNLAQGKGKKKKKTMKAPEPVNRYSFFDLPRNVRLRIYEFTGLLRPCTIRLDPKPSRWMIHGCTYLQSGRRLSVLDLKAGVGNLLCFNRPFPDTLLRVSHAMREDIAPLFAAQNAFSKILANRNDLDVFNSCLRFSFSHLRRLHIDLRPRDRRYLRLDVGGVHKTTWNMWSAFCRHVCLEMPCLTVFSLNCKIRCFEVADHLFNRMEANFPRLSNCAFYFDDTPEENIQPRIQLACERLTSNRDDQPFPFMRLPREIQLMVLGYLLTNRSDPVAYNGNNLPSVGFPCARGIVCLQRRRHFRAYPINPLICCGMCSPLGTMCFCSSRQSAYSTSCICFISPLPFFLVSREFYYLARDVFYSSNTFFFIDEDPEAMIRVTNAIPTSNFMRMRSLAFQFPLAARLHTRVAHRAEETALRSWSVMCRFIREHFDLPRLSLYVLDLGTKEQDRPTVINRARYLQRLLHSFRHLEGLDDFWVYLADDEPYEPQARRVVLGDRAENRTPPRFIRDFSAGNRRHFGLNRWV